MSNQSPATAFFNNHAMKANSLNLSALQERGQSSSAHYWHYFRVVMLNTSDELEYVKSYFYSPEAAIAAVKAYQGQYPEKQVGLICGELAVRAKPEFSLPLEDIADPHTREYVRLHRERIAAMEDSDHA